jgi:hypothetical protein
MLNESWELVNLSKLILVHCLHAMVTASYINLACARFMSYLLISLAGKREICLLYSYHHIYHIYPTLYILY